MNDFQLLENAYALAEHNYALIDRVIYNDIDYLKLPVVEVTTPLLQPQAKLYPYLLSLKELELSDWQKLNQLIAKQIRDNQPPLCSFFIRSDHSTETIRYELANLLIVDFDNINYIQRYYDPLIFIQLSWMFSNNELSDFFNKLSAKFFTFYLNNGWSSLSVGTNQLDDTIYEKLKKHELDRIGIINRCFFKDPTKDLSLTEYVKKSKKINSIIIDAENYGLINVEDKELFTQHRLVYGDSFTKIKLINQKMKEINLYSKSYLDAISEISDEDWKMIEELLSNENKNKE